MVAMFFSRTNSFFFFPFISVSIYLYSNRLTFEICVYKRNLSTHEDHQVEEEKNLFIYTYNVYKKAYVVHVRVS